MWRDKLVICGAIGFVAMALIAVSGWLSSGHKALPPNPKTHTEASVSAPPCATGDLRMAIQVRPPSLGQRQDTGWDAVRSADPVASLVMRNVSDHRCIGGSGRWDFKILDRAGKTVGDWDNRGWFDVNYPPGRSRSFSLPAVYTCIRPGPFTAVAVLDGGLYTARRHGLKLSDITCT